MNTENPQKPVRTPNAALNVIYEPGKRELVLEMYIHGNLARCPLTAEQATQLAQSLETGVKMLAVDPVIVVRK